MDLETIKTLSDDALKSAVYRDPRAGINVRGTFLHKFLAEERTPNRKILSYLSKKLGPELKDELGRYPLHILFMRLNPCNSCIKFVLSDKVLSSKDLAGNTPLHYLAKYYTSHSLSFTKYYISRRSFMIPDDNEEVPIQMANSLRILRAMLSYGVEFVDLPNGIPAPFYYDDSLKKIKLFLEFGMDPNIRTYDGRTLLMITDRTDVAKLLIENGADVNLTDNEGRTALIWSAISDFYEIAKILIDHGADPTVRDVNGRTFVDYARSISFVDSFKDKLPSYMVEILIEKKRDSAISQRGEYSDFF